MPTDDRPHSQRAVDVLDAYLTADEVTAEQYVLTAPERAQVHATLAVGEQLVRLNQLVKRIADVLDDPSTMELLRRGVHVDTVEHVEPQQNPLAEDIGCGPACVRRVHSFDVAGGCQLGI